MTILQEILKGSLLRSNDFVDYAVTSENIEYAKELQPRHIKFEW